MSLKVMPKPGFLINPLHPLSRNLIGWWLFNEGGGININNYATKFLATTASTEFDYNGVLTDANPVLSWGSGPFGQGIFLGSSTERIILNTPGTGADIINDGTKPFSISWWERIDLAPGGNQLRGRCQFAINGASDRFVCFRTTHASYSALSWGKSPNTVQSLSCSDAPSMASSVGVWHHFVISSQTALNTDPTLVRAWVNGVELNVSNGGSYGSTTDVDTIGKVSTNVTAAHLSDFRLYNRLLNDNDVQELFTNPFGNVLTNKLPKFIQLGVGQPPAAMDTGRFLRRRRLLYTRF